MDLDAELVLGPDEDLPGDKPELEGEVLEPPAKDADMSSPLAGDVPLPSDEAADEPLPASNGAVDAGPEPVTEVPESKPEPPAEMPEPEKQPQEPSPQPEETGAVPGAEEPEPEEPPPPAAPAAEPEPEPAPAPAPEPEPPVEPPPVKEDRPAPAPEPEPAPVRPEEPEPQAPQPQAPQPQVPSSAPCAPVYGEAVHVMACAMRPDMQQYAIQLAQEAIAHFQNEKMRIAHHLMTRFELAYGPPWHCVVSDGQLGFFVRYDPDNHIYFSVGGVTVFLFKNQCVM